MKAITGLSASEFNKLTDSFGQELQNEAWIRYETGVKLGNRERKPSGGRIGNLTSDAKKKPKGKELTDDAKAWNRVVSGFRVLVEHAIGGVKRFGIVSDKFRNRKDEFDDKVMLVSCGLWNYPPVVLLN